VGGSLPGFLIAVIQCPTVESAPSSPRAWTSSMAHTPLHNRAAAFKNSSVNCQARFYHQTCRLSIFEIGRVWKTFPAHHEHASTEPPCACAVRILSLPMKIPEESSRRSNTSRFRGSRIKDIISGTNSADILLRRRSTLPWISGMVKRPGFCVFQEAHVD